MEFKGIQKTIVEHLRNEIIIGRIEAGQRLNENELANEYGISRNPIREAFRMLEGENLVVCMPRKGTFVKNISLEDLENLYEVREMIECSAIDILKSKNIRDLPNVASSLELASRMKVPEENNLDEFLSYLNQFVNFHKKLVEASGNDWLINFYNLISSHLKRYQFIYKLYIPEARPLSMKDHRKILSLIKKGEYDDVKRIISEHINNALIRLRRCVS